MEETPPRRSRPKPPSGGSSLPFIPIIIGVVVLGFVIGAGLSVMGKHGSGDLAALATTSPQAESTPSPTPFPTFRLKVVPTRIPSVAHVAKLEPSPAPSTTDTPTPQPSIEATASPSPSSRPPASDAPPPPPVVRVTPRPVTPAPVLAATAAPSSATLTAVVSAIPAVAATANAASTTVFDADGAFSRLAGNVVRQYLLSIARGDTDSAYAALGDGPGSHAGSLPEAGTLDTTMHISKIDAHGSDAAATVDVDLTTANGPYYGQYTVHKSSTGAAIIVSHTFGKP